MPLVHLTELASMHPRLLWPDIIAAAAIVLGQQSDPAPFLFALNVESVPGFGTDLLELSIDSAGVAPALLAALRRTYDPSRLVELAAIAMAGIGLHFAGGHEIRDIALRGSHADYLVDDAGHLLEIAGRSRQSDFASAWRERWDRLSETGQDGY